VSKIGLPGPQSTGSRTGGWFVSNCHGELGARGAAALKTVASFFGGRGFNLGKDCAPANCATASNINPTIILLSEMNEFMFFLFLFAPLSWFRKCGSGKGEEHSGGNVPGLIRSVNEVDL